MPIKMVSPMALLPYHPLIIIEDICENSRILALSMGFTVGVHEFKGSTPGGEPLNDYDLEQNLKRGI